VHFLGGIGYFEQKSQNFFEVGTGDSWRETSLNKLVAAVRGVAGAVGAASLRSGVFEAGSPSRNNYNRVIKHTVTRFDKQMQ
jgi:hypothetical protein